MVHRRGFVSAIAVLAVLLPALAAHGDQTDKYTKPHEPFTAYGMQVRMSVVNPIDNAWQSNLLPTVFQEIAPCRLSSTLESDHFDTPWGGPAYLPNQTRFYPTRGVLETATFVNPCSTAIPSEAIGVVGRFNVTSRDGDGELHLDPWAPDNPNATRVLKFKKGETLMFEAGVMLTPTGTFGVSTWYAGADVTMDVLGYLLPDPAPSGAKGDRGDPGPRGPKGDTGATGAKGDKGDTGATGANGDTGAAGAKGDTGLTGAKGDKGDQGPIGMNGPKGDTGATGAKGDKGDQGPIGMNGPKGDTGATGAKGDKGDQGPMGMNGPKGDTGAAGPKGDKGDQGPMGMNGPKGDTGAAGPKGDKGDSGPKGDTGEAGPQGPIGPLGPMGPMGPIGPQGPIGPMGPEGPRGPRGPASLVAIKGHGCYPPGNNAESQFTVYDAAVTPSSIIILNYTDAGSNGNALAIISQGSGAFQTTGSPNKCFQYVVFNAATEP